MAAPDQPQGLGTPSGDQPGFAPAGQPGQPPAPMGGSATPYPQPGAGYGGATGFAQAPPWQPSAVPTGYPPTPPTGRGPAPKRSTRTRLIAGTLAIALLATALVSLLPLLPRASTTSPTPTNVPSATGEPSRLVTVSPTPQPADAAAVTGGDLGRAVAFTGSRGGGEVTVSSATWTSAGDLEPPAGQRYLVLEVTVSASSGQVAVDALSFLATSADGTRQVPGFGPKLDRPLGGRTLTGSDSVTGQLGFVLAPGDTTVALLDENLDPVAKLKVPGP